jgi:hypothetical protein
MPKTIFIVHEMSGDIDGNSRKVIEICRQLHSEDIIPIVPSFTWRRYLGNTETDKVLVDKLIEEYFRRGMVDELWLFGHRLSDGMKKEIRLAIKYAIPVVPKTCEMRAVLRELLAA